MSNNEFRYHIPPPPGFGRGKVSQSNEVQDPLVLQAAPSQNILPSLSREHFRPLFCFSTPWYSSCDENSTRDGPATEVRPEGIALNEASLGSHGQAGTTETFCTTIVEETLEAGLVDDAVEYLPDNEEPIPRATAGSDPPCSQQQSNFMMSSQATASDEDALLQHEMAVENTISSHSDETVRESESCSESDNVDFDVDSTGSSGDSRDTALHQKIVSEPSNSCSATSSLQGFREDERSPLDPKIEKTVFSSFEEISYGTENAIETDIEFNKTSSTFDTESDNLYSSDSSFGPWRSHYIAEYTIPKLGGDYDDLLATLDSTHAQVAEMKQQYIEILEDLRRKLK